MEKEFLDWFKKNEKRFAHGQFDDKQIAYSAWLEGKKVVNKNALLPDVSTRTLDENDKDVYCIGCGMDEQDGTYKYHRTVANGDEWYCTNCKDYHLH